MKSTTTLFEGGGEMRRGDWLQTYTGGRFWPLDPRPEDVCVLDIAHALANKCRYLGHTTAFYSVAQHCILSARLVPEEDRREALMHDAAEAYWPDIPSPIKRDLPILREFEDAIERAVCEAFGLRWPWPESVKRADVLLLSTERRDLMAPCQTKWGGLVEPMPEKIEAWGPGAAKRAFLGTWKRLNGGEL